MASTPNEPFDTEKMVNVSDSTSTFDESFWANGVLTWFASSSDDSDSMASSSDDSDSMASSSDDSDSMASSSDDSDSMASSSDDSVIGTTSCGTSKMVKIKKNDECDVMAETNAVVARIMYRVERNKKLRKYRETGSWDGDDEITDEDYCVMLLWQEEEKQERKKRAQRVALMHRIADDMEKWLPAPLRPRGSS